MILIGPIVLILEDQLLVSVFSWVIHLYLGSLKGSIQCQDPLQSHSTDQ